MAELLTDHGAEILGRLYLSGPLLYIGLLMIIDPAYFMNMAEMLATSLRNFQRHLSGARWDEPLSPATIHVDAPFRLILALIGAGLSAMAFVVLAGLA